MILWPSRAFVIQPAKTCMRRCIQIYLIAPTQKKWEVDGNHGQGLWVLIIDERNNNEVGLGNTGANTPCGVNSLETANENPCVAVLDGIIWRLSKGITGAI